MVRFEDTSECELPFRKLSREKRRVYRGADGDGGLMLVKGAELVVASHVSRMDHGLGKG